MEEMTIETTAMSSSLPTADSTAYLSWSGPDEIPSDVDHGYNETERCDGKASPAEQLSEHAISILG